MTQLDTGSLYSWIETSWGVRIAQGEEFIEAATATAELASQLHIEPGDPVLRAKRTSSTVEGNVAEYVILHYRADRYRFRVRLVRP